MRRYEKYKDSGIEWVGEIPEHWFLQKCKYLFKEHTGNGFPEDMQGETSGNIPFYKVSDLNGIGIYVNESNNYVSFEDIELKKWNIIPKGSILTAKIGEALRKNHRKICTGDCIVDNNCLGLEPQGIDYKYAFYILKTVDFDWFVNPGAVPSVSMDKLRSFFIPITTNLDEQIAIANYLDKKTAEIDELIKQKEDLLLLYEEVKVGIINNAVTKGINSEVNLKDSGVEWLGMIPEHWKVKRFKYLGKFINGFSFNSSDFVNNGIRVIKISNIQTMTLDWSDESFVEDVFYDNYPSFRVYENDLVFALTRPIISTGIKAAIVNSTEKLLLNQRNSMFRVTASVNTRWMYYLVLSNNFIQEFDKQIDKTGQQPNISSNDIAEIYAPVPEIDEQLAVINYLDNECQRIDEIKIKIKSQLDFLKEYKIALISEVATGKIKVI